MPAPLRWLLRLLPLNPIVVRLVQGGSARSRHNIIRSTFLFVMISVLFILLLPARNQLTYQALAVRGAKAFEIVAYLQIALICILSPVFMAGAIAQESNPRTWEVMLTSPLSSLQMILGHLFGRLFFVLALLVGSLPLFAMTQYFGGVPASSILLAFLVAGSAALLVGAVAVALAVNRLAGRRTVFAFYVGVVSYLALTMAIDQAIGGGRTTWITALNPFLALRALLNPAGYPKPDAIELAQMPAVQALWFGSPVLAWSLVSIGLSTLLIAASTLTVRNIGTRDFQSVPWHRRMFGLGSKGAATRQPRPVGMNPISWREATSRQATLPKLLLRWGFIASGVLWGIGLVAYYHGGGMGHASFRFALLATVWTELVVIALIAINTSATAISREREDGTLDLLLTTPITPDAYLGGKLRGLVVYLSPLLAVPIGTVALAGAYVLLGGLGRRDGIIAQDIIGASQIAIPVVLPETALLLPLVTLPFIAFAVMVGLQWSLKSKGTIGSVVATVGAVGIVTGIVGMCGWQAGIEIKLIGPALSAATPITLLHTGIDPARALSDTNIASEGELTIARISLAVGALIAALAYTMVLLGIRTNMVKTFDREMRKLAGAGG